MLPLCKMPALRTHRNLQMSKTMKSEQIDVMKWIADVFGTSPTTAAVILFPGNEVEVQLKNGDRVRFYVTAERKRCSTCGEICVAPYQNVGLNTFCSNCMAHGRLRPPWPPEIPWYSSRRKRLH